MKAKNRRKQFLVDKKLQFHYLIYIVLTIVLICGAGMMGTYYGVWASVIKAFSEESVRESLVTSAQLNEYEQSRRSVQVQEFASLRIYQETALLSQRQKEVIREIMNETTQKTIALGLLLIFFIGWGSIFITHKVAGPLFKLGKLMDEVGRGNLKARVGFRKFDEVTYLADQFNHMASSLDHSLSDIKKHARQNNREALLAELNKIKTSSE